MHLMVERVRKCPNCGANIEASRFARSILCPFCAGVVLLDPNVVEVARYRSARADWEDPGSQGFPNASRIGDTSVQIGPMVAVGAVSDVHVAVRARAPSELLLVRLLRAGSAPDHFDRAWGTLHRLQSSKAAGAAMLRRISEPVTRGIVENGPYSGRVALVFRPAHGYPGTLADRRRPVDPRATVWVWRRMLEALTFIHASGMVHGALLPPHVLLEAGEHGARLVGFGNAGAPGVVPAAEAAWSPLFGGPTSKGEDLRTSARTIVWALGGDPSRGLAEVPAPYAAVLRAVVNEGATPQGDADAWAIRDRLGAVAEASFGPPAFCPLIPRRR